MGATNVTRFADGAIAASGNAGSITVGSVSVGDLVVFAVNVLTGGVVAEPTSVSDSLGNTITPLLQVTDTTFGPYDVYEIIVTNAGTMTLTATGASGTTTVGIWGSQWTGTASWSYDSNGSVNNAYSAGGGNGQDQQTADITFGAQSVAFAFFGGVGIGANSPLSTDAGWNTASKGSGAFGGDLVADQAMSGGTGHFHAQYASFVYSGGAILSYSYTNGGGFDAATMPYPGCDFQPRIPWRPHGGAVMPTTVIPEPTIDTYAWRPVYPNTTRRPRVHPSLQQAVAQTPVDRRVPYAEAVVPRRVLRTTLLTADQQAFTDGRPDRAVPFAEAVVPDRVVRPTMHASQQPQPERPPYVDRDSVPVFVVAPDRVDRPKMHASLQWSTATREWVFEPPVPVTNVQYPDRVVRAMMLAAEQQAYGDPTYAWGLAPPAPELSWKGVQPDAVARPGMRAADQQAHALPPLPNTSLPAAAAVYPDIVRRPGMRPEEQQATARPNAPDTSLPAAAAIYPDRVPRALPALQVAYTDGTYAWGLVDLSTLAWRGIFPDAVRRPSMPAAQQKATVVPEVPDRNTPLAVSVFPDWISRALYPGAQQPVVPLVPVDQSYVLVTVVAPDRIIMPWAPGTVVVVDPTPVAAAPGQLSFVLKDCPGSAPLVLQAFDLSVHSYGGGIEANPTWMVQIDKAALVSGVDGSVNFPVIGAGVGDQVYVVILLPDGRTVAAPLTVVPL